MEEKTSIKDVEKIIEWQIEAVNEFERLYGQVDEERSFDIADGELFITTTSDKSYILRYARRDGDYVLKTFEVVELSDKIEETPVVIVFETHSGATGAKTSFEFQPEPLVSPVYVGGGTHRKYLTAVAKGTKVTMTRVSNRGNVKIKTFAIYFPVFIDFLGSVKPLPENYIKYAEKLKLK
ncbi:MAG: hypothetical protein QXT14_02830 [Candidatus Bathyarchaeia archaeon]